MKKCSISADSSCEEVAEDLIANCKLKKEDRDKFIKEGISGDVLPSLDITDLQEILGFKLGPSKRIIKYIDENKDRLQPKDISENIPIKNEEEIKSFFKNYIGFEGNLEGIKGENDLKQLKEADINKLELNLGQRIKLNRYINYFNSLKEKKIKELKITISKESSDEEVLNYLKNELNISDESIEKLGLDEDISDFLFGDNPLSEKDINNCLNKNEIKQEEYEMLKKFIEKRDEMIKQESIKISKESSEEEIYKFIKEKLNFDIDKQNIKELNLDKYENINEEEKEILINYINKIIMKQKEENINIINNNIIYSEAKIGNEDYEIYQKVKNNNKINLQNKKKNKIKIEDSTEIFYWKKDLETLQKDSDYNIFFILSTKNESISNLRFAVFQKTGTIFKSYFNYEFHLINKAGYSFKNKNYCLLMFQVTSDYPISKISFNVKDFDNSLENPVYESSEITLKEGNNNYFILDDEKSDYYKYFPKIDLDEYFSEYLDYFFDEKKDIINTIKNDLLRVLSNKIENTKNIELSGKNILKLIGFCGPRNIELKKLENIKIEISNEKLDKNYYKSIEFIKGNYKPNEQIMICSILLKIYSIYDIDELLKMINEEVYSKMFYDLMFVSPQQNIYSYIQIKKGMNENQLKKLQKELFKIIKNLKEIQNIINIGESIEDTLNTVFDNLNIIIPIIEKERNKFKGFQWNNPKIQDNISNIYIIFNKIMGTLKLTKREYSLFNIEDIIEKMIDTYINKENFEEYLLLGNFIKLGNNINTKIIDKFHKNIHEKGISLIKNDKMTPKQIANFIKCQDYYYGIKYVFDEKKRDPTILNYIKITSKFKDYKENIKLIKDYELYKLYDNSTIDMKKMFYSEILKQIQSFNDIESIFEIFPSGYITGLLLDYINRHLKELLKSIDKKNCNISYSVIDKWLTFNFYDDIFGDLDGVIKALNEFNNFTTNYYLYLMKKDDMKTIFDKIRYHIISFFIEHNQSGLVNEEVLITLLKEAPNENFTKDFVKNIDTKILKETDFYTKNVTPNFEFFKRFFEIINKDLEEKLKGYSYIEESTITKTKIIDDLKNQNVQYEKINGLISDDDSFLEKIKVLAESNEEAEKLFNHLKESIEKCKKKFQQLELIMDYYKQFYKEEKNDQFILIKNKLNELYNTNISDILAKNNFFKNNDNFDFDEAIEDCKNIKYRNSKFFMIIYEKNKENYKKSEDERFKQSIKEYQEVVTNILTQKEKNLKFFEINNIHDILNVVSTYKNNLKEEIDFTLEEFKDLNKEEYIKNELLNDLINYSKKDKALKLLEGIQCFIEIFKEIKNIEISEYLKEIENLNSKLSLEDINKEEITEIINILLEKGFDINNETPVMKFYSSIKKDAILFLKKLMNLNFDIRNLNEFVVENAASEIQTSHIDNLIYVFEFFVRIFNNKEITTDKTLIEIFRNEINNNKEIWTRIDSYQKIYGEINRIYDQYGQNPVMTHKKIKMILDESFIDIFKDEINNEISFKITYKQKIEDKEKDEIIDVKKSEELRNKILLSFNNSGKLKDENEGENADKKKISNEYINLIDNIKQLTNTLNSLLHTGYPYIIDLKLNIKNSLVNDENGQELKNIMDNYKKENDKFKKLLEDAYEKFPLLRLFYGQQFIKLFNLTKNKENKNIFHLINSVALNRINNMEIDYKYNNDINELENINQYLELLFKNNDIKIDELYEENKVLEEKNLPPGIYRRVISGDKDDIINNILNVYLNLTNNIPIINYLLICNEETTIENIQSFLYRAIFCDKPILFLISNIECMELFNIKNLIKILKVLYKVKKNRKINSYILFFYEKKETGLARFLEKFVSEKNNLDISYINMTEKKYKDFEKIEVYSSEFAGYGKTTEIKNKAKEKNGNYFYLPVGGTLTRDYIIKNLINLNIDLKKGNENYLHLDLSETDNDELMTEILFKLIVLKYIDSKRNIYYLGYDLNLMIELPKSFYNFNEKYKILNLFNNIQIKELKPLRLEEDIKYIKDSPISIVAEVLDLYDKNQIEMNNIDLDAPITKTAEECEKIINKYFNVENQNYYQKMNFIKILSIQFKKFTENLYLNCEFNPEGEIFLIKIRKSIIYNFIELTKVFTRSPYDSLLLRQNQSRLIFGKINENQAKEDELMKLADESNKQEIFSFEKVKPSLVFFNRDGSSLSIISNNDKNEKYYKDLRLLWNLSNPKLNEISFEELIEVVNYRKTDILNDLIDYKSLNHEKFLEQIKNIFCLDKLSINDLKDICTKLGNYIFVSDNFIKMVAILLNIEAKIPVILMGETGVGKTKLLEMLATLYGKGEPNWHKLQIHAGTTDQIIVEFIEKIEKKYQSQENLEEPVWIFFDEINTCNSLGLITEIMCNHTYLGKKINKNFVFLGACNPYRIITKQMKVGGLVYYNTKEKNKLNNLVYTVNPLPHSLLNFIFDFGSLQPEDEKKYITNTIIDILTRLKEKEVIKDFDKIKKEDIKKIKEEIIESIVICHDFMRKKYDRASVSLREIRRFGIFFEYFIKYFKGNKYETLKDSLNMTLYLCYYLRLNEKKVRKELAKELQKKKFLMIF